MPIIDMSNKYLLQTRLAETELQRILAPNQKDMLECLQVFKEEEHKYIVNDTNKAIMINPKNKREIYKQVIEILRGHTSLLLKEMNINDFLIPLCYDDEFTTHNKLSSIRKEFIKREIKYYNEYQNITSKSKKYRDEHLLKGILGCITEASCPDIRYITLGNGGGGIDFDKRYEYLMTKILPIIKEKLTIVKWERTKEGIISLSYVPNEILMKETDGVCLMYLSLPMNKISKLKEDIKIINAYYRKEAFVYSNKITNESYFVFGIDELYALLTKHYLEEEACLRIIKANKEEALEYLSNRNIFVGGQYELMTGEVIHLRGIEETGRVLVDKTNESWQGEYITHHSVEPELILSEETSNRLKANADVNRRLSALDSNMSAIIADIHKVRHDIEDYRESRKYLDRRVEEFLPVSTVEKRIIEEAKFDDLNAYEKALLDKKKEDKYYKDMEDKFKPDGSGGSSMYRGFMRRVDR